MKRASAAPGFVARVGFGQVRAPRARPQFFAFVPALVLLSVAYLVPIGRLVVDSFLVNGSLSVERYAELLSTPVFGSVVWRTLGTSALVTALCLALGYPFAYAIHRLPARWLAIALLVVTIPFFTSTLIRSYAWVAILGNNGVLNQSLIAAGVIETPLRLVHNHVGVVIGMVQVQLPLMILPLVSVMRRFDSSLRQAAESLGASRAEAFWHVFLPLSMPGIAAGVTLVFVVTLGFYVTPALLGGPGEYLVAQSIETRVSNILDFGAAAAQSTVLLAVVLAIVFAFRRNLGLTLEADAAFPARLASSTRFAARVRLAGLGRSTSGLRERLLSIGLVALERTRGFGLGLAVVVVSVYLVVPMIVVVLLAFSDGAYLSFPPPGYSLRWFEGYFSDERWLGSTVFSLGVAASAALTATLTGVAAAFALARGRNRLVGPLHLLTVSPLVIPHIIVGVAAFFLLAPLGLVGNPLSFIATYAVLGLPYVVITTVAVLRRFDPSLEQAAASLGAPPLRVVWSVTLPIIRAGIASGFVFAFLIAFDDLVVALFLSAPGAVTLPIRMWEDVRFEITPRIAAVGTLFLAITAGAIVASTVRAPRRRQASSTALSSE